MVDCFCVVPAVVELPVTVEGVVDAVVGVDVVVMRGSRLLRK